MNTVQFFSTNAKSLLMAAISLPQLGQLLVRQPPARARLLTLGRQDRVLCAVDGQMRICVLDFENCTV